MIEYPELYGAAIRLLAAREHSCVELRQKLSKKTLDSLLLDRVIASLQQENYLNDARFAEVFVRQKAASGKGPYVIRQLLQSKGVSQEDAALAIQEAECDWYELALNVYRKKFKTPISDAKDRAKRMRFLMSRGFSGDVVSSIVDAGDE